MGSEIAGFAAGWVIYGRWVRDPQRIYLITGLLRKACMTGGWIPLVLRMVTDLDFSAWQLLLLGTAIESGVVLAEIPTGVVADTFSRKWSVVIGTFALGAAQFAAAIAEEWIVFLIIQFLWGVGWTFISGAEIAWVTDEVGSAVDVEPLLLRRARLEFLALIVGIVVFAGIGQVVSLQAAVLFSGSIGIGWAVALAVLMRETRFVPATESRVALARSTLTEGARFTWSTKGLRVLGLVLLVGGMAAEAIDRTDIRRLEDIGLSETTSAIGFFAAVAIARAVLSGLVLWRYENRFAGVNVVTGFAALLALSAVGVAAFAHIELLAAAMVVLVAQGGVLEITDPLMGTWTNSLAPSAARATVHSFIGQLRAFGEILGGVLLGAVASIFTLPTTLSIAAVLFGIAALVSLQARNLVGEPPVSA